MSLAPVRGDMKEVALALAQAKPCKKDLDDVINFIKEWGKIDIEVIGTCCPVGAHVIFRAPNGATKTIVVEAPLPRELGREEYERYVKIKKQLEEREELEKLRKENK